MVFAAWIALVCGFGCYLAVKTVDGGTRRFKGKFHRWLLRRHGLDGLLKWGALNVLLAFSPLGFWLAGNTFMWALLVIVFWVINGIVDLDDLINGKERPPKERWAALKNKVRWKMQLPAPVRPVTGTA